MSERSDEIPATLSDLARACRILALEGHEDITLGHLSWRDPQGRGLWLKRAHIGLGEVAGDDFVLVDFTGKVLAGNGARHVEWPIHAEILQARPEVNFVGHTHAFYAVLVSCLEQDLRPYTHAGIWFGDPPPRFTKTSELIATSAMGRDLAGALGRAQTVLMRNHGAAFVGRSVAELCMTGVFLRDACRFHIMLAQTGLKTVTPDRDEVGRKRQTLIRPENIEGYWRFYCRRLAEQEGRRA